MKSYLNSPDKEAHFWSSFIVASSETNEPRNLNQIGSWCKNLSTLSNKRIFWPNCWMIDQYKKLSVTLFWWTDTMLWTIINVKTKGRGPESRNCSLARDRSLTSVHNENIHPHAAKPWLYSLCHQEHQHLPRWEIESSSLINNPKTVLITVFRYLTPSILYQQQPCILDTTQTRKCHKTPKMKSKSMRKWYD